MADQRKAGIQWRVADETGSVPTWERVSIAVLMDIRDELQRLNALLYCPNFTGVPTTLRTIAKNTKKRGRRKARQTV